MTADSTTPPPTQASPVVVGDDGVSRCSWADGSPEYRRYHDDEWGVPLRDERRLYEKICLEGFQAGLSWITILRRREAFREAFYNFDIERVGRMTPHEVERLLQNDRIIRHRGKIEATIQNARAAEAMQGGLTDYIWSFAPEPGNHPRPRLREDVPAITLESKAMSAGLRTKGFRFFGPTTAYALMQSAGLVDDHFEGCWRADS
jgi:DNA-3-methyladenine glycosylase I